MIEAYMHNFTDLDIYIKHFRMFEAYLVSCKLEVVFRQVCDEQ